MYKYGSFRLRCLPMMPNDKAAKQAFMDAAFSLRNIRRVFMWNLCGILFGRSLKPICFVKICCRNKAVLAGWSVKTYQLHTQRAVVDGLIL